MGLSWTLMGPMRTRSPEELNPRLANFPAQSWLSFGYLMMAPRPSLSHMLMSWRANNQAHDQKFEVLNFMIGTTSVHENNISDQNISTCQPSVLWIWWKPSGDTCQENLKLQTGWPPTALQHGQWQAHVNPGPCSLWIHIIPACLTPLG